MRVFHIHGEQFIELQMLPADLPPEGFLWVGCARQELPERIGDLQQHLQGWGCGPLVDLHVSDLLNSQLPSHYDYTSWYDLLVFRRLAAAGKAGEASPPALLSIDTSPVGFALFDRVLISIHPDDCAVREYFAARMGQLTQASDFRGSARLPSNTSDLMLRMVNHMVDSYLELRRQLTRQLVGLQQALMDPRSRFSDWQLLLDARNSLHLLEDTCEDQRSAIQEWLDALEDWPMPAEPQGQRERELLRVRSRDVLEHVERVLSHVRRLESSSESAVQMHFSALSHRTNAIMRTLTVLTAIFLPLNLITGIFGMNFDALPLIHNAKGVWIALGLMLALALALGAFFWRKRYLGTQR
ncbi:magnesium transporter CorA family protein [Paucibacter sp. M5-1]|uniref:magnesium transporter CorA family protein n=1 Tax=Paucibacter sp. M5-1 TaxID=3015998 RepID=UPI0022B90DB9|nr:magnesium transporter CorA family protein [Paucibacter sp. M5-1]MCZ7881348.1 magnesium transporter CorA family protein [Paucibacter sp. M5-1]